MLPERAPVDAGENGDFPGSGVVCSDPLLLPTGVRFSVCDGGVLGVDADATSIPNPRLGDVASLNRSSPSSREPIEGMTSLSSMNETEGVRA